MRVGQPQGPIGFLLGLATVEKLIRWEARRIAVLLNQSGQVGNPAVIAAGSVEAAVRATLIVLPLSVVASLGLSPLFLCANLIPVVLLAVPELRLRDRVARRREGVEGELPFFAALITVLGGAGVSLYSALSNMSSSDAFASMKNEALLVRRDVAVFGMNPNESFERLASSHPSRRFSDFLFGYTSKARSGGDIPAYLTSESGSLLRELEEGWTRYVARVGIVGSMMITVFGVVPLLLMVVGVFSPGFSIVGLVFFTGVGVPVFTVSLLYLAGRMQPMHEEQVQGRAARSILLALPGAAVGAIVGQAWIALALFLLVFFVAFGLSVREQLAEVRAVEDGVSRFLKDLLEYKRQEYDLAKAVVAIESSCSYNGQFGRILSKVANQLRAGIPLDEVKVECRSRLGKLVFLLLGQMSRSGGGTVDSVYQVSNFADRMMAMRRSAAAEMKPYLVLSYVSPLLLAFGVTFVEAVLSSFSNTVRPGFSAFHSIGVQVGNVPPVMSQVADLLIVVSAASLGLIGAKMTDLTVRNTLRASTNVALAVAAVAIMAVIGSRSLSQLFGV